MNSRATSALKVQILGPMRIWRDGEELDPGPRQQATVLAVLLSRYGRPVSMSELTDAVWGDAAPTSAVNVVHKYIGTLRRLLEPELLAREPGTLITRRGNSYVCAVGPEVLDLALFRERLNEARTLNAQGSSADALESYLSALELWSGPACDGMAEGVSTASHLSALNGELLDACRLTAGLATTLDQPARAIPALRLACKIDPLNEPLHTSLITCLGAIGERAEALTVHDAVRRRLADELGIDPGHSLQAAYREVLDPAGEDRDTTRDSRPTHADRAVAAEPYRVADFSGRLAELESIRAFVSVAAESQRAASVLLITGPPGVGKTTTALEAIHGASATGSRLFANLHGFDADPLSPIQVLRSLLAQVNPGEEPPGLFDEAAAAWRTAASARPLVVVLDNASSEAQVRPVLAVDARITVIVTSRRTLTGLEATERIGLGPLPRNESIELLQTMITEPQVHGPSLTTLAELCGDFPLALRIAGARIASRPQWSVDDFIERLRDERNRLQQLVAGDLAVETAFSLSYTALHPTNRRLFRSLAQLHGTTFSARMAAALDNLDPLVCRGQLDALSDLGLVEVMRGDRYRMHDLLRLYAADRLRDETSIADARDQLKRLNEWILETTTAAAAAFPSGRDPVSIAHSPRQEAIEAAREWLTSESSHWFGALASASKLGQHRAILDTTMALARLATVWEQWGQWVEVHLIGAESAAALNDWESYVIQLYGVAEALQTTPVPANMPPAADGSPEDTEQAARRAIAAAEKWGQPRWAARARICLASAHFESGNLDASLREARRSAAECTQLDDILGEIDARAWIVRTLTQLDPVEASAEAHRFLAVIDGLGPRPERVVPPVALVNFFNTTSRLLISLNRFDEVLAISTRMIDLPEHLLDSGGYPARALRHRGFALLGLGQFEDARVALESALSLAGSYRPDWWAADIQNALDSIPTR